MADYNGWSNWETWQVPLWVDNEESSYKQKRYLLRTLGAGECTGEDAKNIFDVVFPAESFPFGTPDMERGDLGKVNWDEIAVHWEEERQEILNDA